MRKVSAFTKMLIILGIIILNMLIFTACAILYVASAWFVYVVGICMFILGVCLYPLRVSFLDYIEEQEVIAIIEHFVEWRNEHPDIPQEEYIRIYQPPIIIEEVHNESKK